MTINFGFAYEVVFYNPDKVNNFIIPQTIVSPTKVSQGTNGVSPDGIVLKNKDYLDYNTISGTNFSISGVGGKGLQLEFDITQTKDSTSPTKLKFINLSDEIIENIKVDTTIIVRAGYRSNLTGDFVDASVEIGSLALPDLFVGQVVAFYTDSSTVDKVTEIMCGEGRTVQRNSRVSRTFPANSTRLDVINKLVSDIKSHGIPLGRITLPDSGTRERRILDSPYLSGYSCYGYLMAELTKVAEACNMRVFMASGRLYIEPTTQTKEQIPLATVTKPLAQSVAIVKITPSNVKGSVNASNISANNTPSNADGKKESKTLSLTTYLDGRISIDKVVELSGFDVTLNGEYSISSLKYVGNYRGGTWETQLTLESL
jgi:hypothetical protein